MLKHFTLRFAILFFCVASSTYSINAQQWGDYTLYSTMTGTTTYLVDTNGTNFHTWTHTSSNRTGYSSHLLPGGILLRSVVKSGNSFTGGPICGQVQKVDWNGNIIWDYVYSTTQYCSHHDIAPMPNGNVLLIAYERKTAAEVSAAGCTQSIEMWPDKIVEIEPVGATGGNVVWEWHAWDHLVQNVDPTKANYYPSISDHPELLNINYNTQKDWLHMNGISFNPILNQIAWSSHNMSEIYVIDHSTTTAEAAGHTGGNSGKGGDILYRWGHPAAYATTGAQILNVTHDAHWNPENVPNPGYLCAYNNKGISSNASCADQVEPPVTGYTYAITPGSAFQPTTYTLRQASGGYNSNMGSFQVLPNGNILLVIATAGVIKEFSPTGTLLWSKTATGAVPKAFRYDSCYVFNTPPALPEISESNDTLYATSATTYQWYLNGQQIAGANSQEYVPLQDGIYLVRITDANGCVYRYSTDYHFTFTTGIEEATAQNSIKLFPNPSTGIFYISGSSADELYDIVVSDAVGSVIMDITGSNVIDLTGNSKGIYFVQLVNSRNEIITRKISLNY
jgi:hypothetical protein